MGLGAILAPLVFMVTGPIPLYNNPPIEPQYFQTWTFAISAITLGVTTTVTLVIPAITNMNYSVGQLVRFLIPPTFGSRELNGQTGYVIAVTPPDQVTVALNSTTVSPYIASSATTPAQLIPVGDVNTGQISSTGLNIPLVTIPGSFQNISPL